MTIDRYLNVDRYDEEALLDDAIVPLTPEAVVTDDSRAELARVRDELAEVRSAYKQDVEVLATQLDVVAAELCVTVSRHDFALDALRTGHREELARLTSVMEAAAADAAEQVARCHAQIALDQGRVAELQARIDELQSSTSWRLTAGLRLVSKLISGA